MSNGSMQQGRSRSLIKRIAIGGTKVYLTLAVVQFLLGLLFGGTLALLGYDLAAVDVLFRQ